MHSVGEIWGSLNYRNNSYYGMCTVMQSIVFVVVVVVLMLNVMEAPRSVVVDGFGRCGKLSTHAVVVWNANAVMNKNADRVASQWFSLTF
jgi:S-adenosylhomocysteine hydrolase